MKPTEEFTIRICDFLDLDSDMFDLFLQDLRAEGWERWGGGTVEVTVAEIAYVLVRMLAPSNILELGTNMAYSAAHIALAVNHSELEGEFVTVESDKGIFMMGANHLANKKMANVRQILGDSVTVSSNLGNRMKFDFIFVDSSHEYAHTKKEIGVISKILCDGGLVLFHDAVNEKLGVKRAVEEMNKDEWDVLILDTQPNTGLAITRRK